MVCDFIHALYVQGSENYFQIIRFQKRLMVQVVKSAKKNEVNNAYLGLFRRMSPSVYDF